MNEWTGKMIFQTSPIPKMPQNPLGAKAQLGHLRYQGTETSAWLDQERLLREDDAVTFTTSLLVSSLSGH